MLYRLAINTNKDKDRPDLPHLVLPAVKTIDLCDEVIRLRTRLNFNKREMATYLEVDYKTYLRWERKKNKPSLNLAYNIALIHSWLDQQQHIIDKTIDNSIFDKHEAKFDNLENKLTNIKSELDLVNSRLIDIFRLRGE